MNEQPYLQIDWPTRDDRPYVAINMVSTVDGKATINGGAHGIGDYHDHDMMQQLRVNADAVMSGAGTLIKEDIVPQLEETYQQERRQRGLPPLPQVMTITSHTDFDWTKRFFDPQYRPLIYFTGDDPAGLTKHATVVRVNRAQAAAELLRHAKHELGIDRLLVEGGPTFNWSLLAAGLADELLVTVSPKISGLSGISIVEGDRLLELPLQLRSSTQINSELFLRYRIGVS